MITVGIDLGTTFSVVARVDDSGLPVVVLNPEGRTITPSVVYVDRGNILVGTDARNAGLVDPERVVTCIKRFMGTEYSLKFDGTDYTPETISALILKALVANAATGMACAPDEFAAVVTVPAYFGITEREATAQAAGLAGIELLDLVAEPVAAAAFYGIDARAARNVLVFDLGGGTFDTTVLQMLPDGPNVIVTDGDSRLGGVDWNDRLADLVLERFADAADIDDADSAVDDVDFQEQLGSAIEKAKIALTARQSVPVTLDFHGRRVTVDITRAEFERATSHLVDNCLAVADRAIAAAYARGSGQLEQVVLVGGATRMPMLRTALARHFGVQVALTDPDLAVAKGAALHAHSIVSAERRTIAPSSGAARRAPAIRPVQAVLPRALGVLIHDSRNPSGRRMVSHIVEANTRLPVTNVRARFATLLDGQDRIRVEVYEQSGAITSPEVQHNRRVLDGELVDVPELAAGSPIDIEFTIGTDGRITCVAEEPKSGQRLILESCIEGVIDNAEAERQKASIAGLRIQL